MSSQSSERRHFTRINFDAHFKLSTVTDTDSWQGNVADLSLKGVLIDTPTRLECHTGDHFKLELQILQNELTISMDVHVAHHDDQHIGFEWEHIDIDSMTHLRRILELNLADPKLLERELHDMLSQ